MTDWQHHVASVITQLCHLYSIIIKRVPFAAAHWLPLQNILNHLSGSWHLQPVQVHISTLQQHPPDGLQPDADGNVAATLVVFKQLAAPKGDG